MNSKNTSNIRIQRAKYELSQQNLHLIAATQVSYEKPKTIYDGMPDRKVGSDSKPSFRSYFKQKFVQKGTNKFRFQFYFYSNNKFLAELPTAARYALGI
jgi:hypothetical protein